MCECPMPGDECIEVGCDASGQCTFTPVVDGTPCEGGLVCSVFTCLMGACTQAGPFPCPPPPDACSDAVCDEMAGGCVPTPKPNGSACDDGNLCTFGDTCTGGTCSGAMVQCPTGDQCVTTACDPMSGCVYAPIANGTPCNDGHSCTVGETCNAGSCGNGMGPVVYFQEDFSDNGKGWSLGPEWQIGPAKASMGGAFGADPPIDHTPGLDNGVAGVVIGGNADTMQHPMAWLESPTFDTSAAPTVFLSFYRWLVSDYDPWMHNAIEVWNGAQWVGVWQTGMQMNDAAWTFQSFDVTAHKNANMRVRFGFDITNAGAFMVPSWSVDDVMVASASCP